MFNLDEDIDNTDSNYFYNSNVINIKILNGDIFPIELNYFDDENKIINKICFHDDKYRLRKHRLKIIVNTLENNDTLYVYSEPPDNKKEYYSKYGLDSMFNFFYINEKKDYYDTIDRLFFKIYDEHLPSLFIISKNFYMLGYVQMYIDTLIKTIFENEDMKHVFLKSNNYGEMNQFFIDCIIKYYRDLDTIGLDFSYISYNKYKSQPCMGKLFNKMSNTKNIYLNSYILKEIVEINFLNTENLYILTESASIRDDLYSLFKKIKSVNHTIFINHNIETYYRQEYKECREWINVGLINNYYTYRHISTLDNYQLFNNYDLV
jgi:hypothetical protein